MLKNSLLKIRRLIIRSSLKVVDRKTYKTRSEYWPWINIRNSATNHHEIFSFTQKLATSKPVCELTCAKKSFSIVGAGPSINDVDFSKIENTNIILLNGAISLIHKKSITPFYCIIIDSSFIENRFDIVRELPSGTHLLTTLGCLRAIHERDPHLIKRLNISVTQNVTAPTHKTTNSDLGPLFKTQGYPDDLDVGYIDGGTVMAVGLQLALQLDAHEILLLGLDINNVSQPRFYEKHNQSLKSGLLKDYQHKILPFMMKMARVCRDRGILIYNCSSVSKLPYDIIPFMDIRKVAS